MTLAEESRARVAFKRQASDGNYGSETAEVAIDVPLGIAYELSEEAIAATLALARRLVHDELRHSPSPFVVRALEYPVAPKPAPAAPDLSIPDLPIPEEFRYVPFLVYDEGADGTKTQRCTSCGICAKVCPPRLDPPVPRNTTSVVPTAVS